MSTSQEIVNVRTRRRLSRVGPLTVAAAAVLAVAVPASAKTSANQLTGTVGPGSTITLRTASGKSVRSLKPGTYQIRVKDLTEMHNFALRGPGVAKATSVPGVGSTTWTMKIRKGTYTFVCDPHPATMRGTFTAK